jgi:hypothetical protein
VRIYILTFRTEFIKMQVEIEELRREVEILILPYDADREVIQVFYLNSL